MALIDQVVATINQVSLTNNFRSQLAAALRLVPKAIQKQLAVDFAEHVIWICDGAFGPEARFREAIDYLRAYLNGECSLHEVEELRARVFSAYYKLREEMNNPAGEAAVTLIQAIYVCIKDDPLAHEFIYTKIRDHSDATTVAHQASYAAALYEGMRMHNEELKKPAVDYAASKRETQWQIDRLLETLRSKS